MWTLQHIKTNRERGSPASGHDGDPDVGILPASVSPLRIIWQSLPRMENYVLASPVNRNLGGDFR